jgi:hypothetical protein
MFHYIELRLEVMSVVLLFTMENTGELILYQTPDGQTKIQVQLFDETVWLTQAQLCELFQKSKATTSEHITRIFEEGELEENSVVRFFRTTAADGKKYNTAFYNLDVIISVGYRVKSHRGTQFRIWATQRLREYIVKGFTLDDERLKAGGSTNYFKELLERIRDIRSSEKVFYQQVRDIYTTSIDYDPNTKQTQNFFAVVQNKLLWAISGNTAAEIINSRASAKKINMGLTTWANGPEGVIRKTDTTISKNYLTQSEITALNLLVEQFLAFAEAQAQAQKPMYMKDWIKKLNDIITINDREILEHAGKISKQLADEIAETQYDIYKQQEKQIAQTNSIPELENDIKQLTGNHRKTKK